MRRSITTLAILLTAVGPALADNYGAIAYNRDSFRYGYAIDWATQQQAEQDALNRCGASCEMIVHFSNGCAAIAASDDKSVTWGYDASTNAAKRRAMSQCQMDGTGCTIQTSVCTSPKPVYSTPHIESGAHPGRHGCWTSDFSARIIGCKD